MTVLPRSRDAVARSPSRADLLQRGLWLEYLTLSWNVVGCGVVLVAAWLAGSVALAGFGLDSVIEIFASVVVVWQLRGIHLDRERMALCLIGTAFFILPCTCSSNPRTPC